MNTTTFYGLLFSGVGKRGFTSRQLQQAFACKAPAIVFYTEMLEKMGALKILFSVKSCGKHVSREHYWFHNTCQTESEFKSSFILKIFL